MKKVLFGLFVTLLCPLLSRAADYYTMTINGVHLYCGTTSAGVDYAMVVNYNGAYGSYSGNVVIPSSVDYNGTTYPVVRIYSSAFRECPELISVTIPQSVTQISSHAFENSGITSIVIPTSVTSLGSQTFKGCTKLESIVIPGTLGNGWDSSTGMFSGCTSLKSAVLGEGITAIPEAAFKDCTALETIVIPSTVTSIGENAVLAGSVVSGGGG